MTDTDDRNNLWIETDISIFFICEWLWSQPASFQSYFEAGSSQWSHKNWGYVSMLYLSLKWVNLSHIQKYKRGIDVTDSMKEEALAVDTGGWKSLLSEKEWENTWIDGKSERSRSVIK